MKKDKYLAIGYASLIMGVIPFILSISYFYSNYDPGYGPFPFPPYIAWSILVLGIIPITAIFVGWYYLLIGFGKRSQPQGDKLSVNLILLGEVSLGIVFFVLKSELVVGGAEMAGLIGAVIAGFFVMYIGLPSLIVFCIGVFKSKALPKWRFMFLLALLLGAISAYLNQSPMTEQGFKVDRSYFIESFPDSLGFVRKNCRGYKIYTTWTAAKLNPERVCVIELDPDNNPRQEETLADISIFPNLIGLEWYGDQTKSLPQGLGKLTNLRVLIIHNLYTDFLPPDFYNLKNLTDLAIDNSHLQELPDSISNLSNLETLIMNGHSLRKISPSIGSLKKLTWLFLGGFSNKSHLSLPKEIGDLSNLETLTVTSSNLEKIPSSIGNLKKLTRLNLNYNKIRELPDEVGNLSSLEVLSLKMNDLRSLPKSLVNLSKLIKIDASRNPLLIVPQEILDIKKWDLCAAGVFEPPLDAFFQDNKCIKYYNYPPFYRTLNGILSQ